MQKEMNKEKFQKITKMRIYFIFSLLFIIGGCTVLIHSNYIDITPEWKEYEFRVKFVPTNARLNEFMLYYDFKENKGNISFSPNPTNFEKLIVYIPIGINYSEVLLINNEGHIYKEDIDYKKETKPTNKSNMPSYNYLDIKEIKNLNIQKVVIQLTGEEFYPNGLFTLDIRNRASPGFLHAFLEFDKGNYDCTTNCFFNYHNDLGFIPKGDKVMIYLREKEGQEDSLINYNWFNLNMIDQDKVNEKQIENSLSVSLLVAGLILIIEFFIIYLLKKKENLIKKDKLKVRDMKTQNKKILKLEYEHNKGYTFAFFSAVLLVAFGTIANINKIKGKPLILMSIVLLGLLTVCIISLCLMESKFRKLKQRIIDEEKSKNKKP